ncbi:MAG: response regulator [Ardenticatenaceae bacterium]|nr:response regulator [Ardenticatenaceae bacterium]MCB8948943.1 response regulator [Ardenticatenaceae bacterium]
MSSSEKILIIDDDAIVRQSFVDYLDDLGYETLMAENGRIGLDLLSTEYPDLVLVDLRMPEMNGLQFMKEAIHLNPDLPIIVISGANRIEGVIKAQQLGSWDYLMKPVTDLSLLGHAVHKALEKVRLIQENRAYQEKLEALVYARTKELEQTNGQLTASEERYRTLFERSADAIFIIDVESGQYINANQAAERLTGYTIAEIKTKTTQDLIPKGATDRLNQARTLVSAKELGEVTFTRADGAERIATLAAFPLQNGKLVVNIARDITQRKQREEEHVRQERLAAVGQLAAGIAHDFNNVMAVITLYSDLLQRSANLSENELRRLKTIHEQARHAAALTQQILDFSRRSVREPRPMDLKAFINEMVKFIERTISERVQVRFRFEEGDYTINADPTQLQQAITNLTVNARDAMPQGGVLSFDLSPLTVLDNEAPPHSGMSSGEWVALTISDTGVGISSEAQAHIFEPFFTTKEVGKGTGLGLAQVYGIVQQHKGCIAVESQLGKGSTFTIYLPALVQEPTVIKEDRPDLLPQGQGETILLVEDNEILLEATSATLRSLNYRAITAVSGEEALNIYRAQPEKISLVLADVVMPKMDGFALAQALQQQPQPPKVLLMSGFPRDIETPAEIRQLIVGWLTKPLDACQLADALHNALAAE